MFIPQAACTWLAVLALGQVPVEFDAVRPVDLPEVAAATTSLELRLVAERERYPLGRRAPIPKAVFDRGRGDAAPVILAFELKNTGKTPLELRASPEPALKLHGPDGKPIAPQKITTFFVAPSVKIELAPGETRRVLVHELAYLDGRDLKGLRWAGAGDHNLQGEWQVSIDKRVRTRLTSNPLTLHVDDAAERQYWLGALADKSASARWAAAKYVNVMAAAVPVEKGKTNAATTEMSAGLTRALALEADGNVAVALLQGLERFGPSAKESHPVVRKRLLDVDLQVRAAAVPALIAVAPSKSAAVKDLLPLLHDPHAQVRRTLAEHLSAVLHNDSGHIQPDVLAALRKAVAVEPDDVALSYVIRTLGNVPDPVVIRDLLPHLESDLQTKHRFEAVTALGNIIFWMPAEKRKLRDDDGSPVADAVSALVKVLRDNDPARSAAIYSLMQIGPDAAPAVPLLIAEVQKPGKKDDFNSDRIYAVRALSAIGTGAKAAVEVLVEKGLRDENWQLRESAVTALGKIKSRPDLAVPALTKMFADERDIVAVRAIEALVEFGPDAQDALPALRKLAERRDIGPGIAAREALKQIEKR